MTTRIRKCVLALLFPCLASNALAGPFELDTEFELDEIDTGLWLSALDTTTYYQLWSAGEGVADVMWASNAEYQGVFLWPDNTSFSQEFELLDSGGGFFRLRARHSGQCLMLDWRSGYYNGTPVIQYPHCDAGYAGSEWQVRYVYTSRGANGYPQSVPTLVNRATGRCLDAANASGYPRAQSVLQQWDCITTVEDWNADNQTWHLLDADPPPSVLH
jgi:Ricin-type beta-trefoil lectin domain-like